MPLCILIFFFKPKTAYEMRISDWSSDVCSSDLVADREDRVIERRLRLAEPGGRAAPPVIDQYVKVGEPLDMVPPHRRDEDRVARLKLHRLRLDRKSTRLNSSH